MKRIKIVEPRKCVCRMSAGEARRVGVGPHLIGYYIACPHCGMANVVLADEQSMTESGGSLVAFGPGHRCTRCRLVFRLVAEVFEVDVPALPATG